MCAVLWPLISKLVFSPKPRRRRLRTMVRLRSCTSRPSYFTEAEKLLSGVKAKSFASRDEQEVAGYADAMDMVSESFESITITENHIKQLHGVLLKYSSKDQDHRGHYKKVPNHVEAFALDG